jgi:hypothetical protein
MTAIDRRQALALLGSLALVPRAVVAQAKATAAHRVLPGFVHGLLLEPGGTLRAWHVGRSGEKDTAIDALGLGQPAAGAVHAGPGAGPHERRGGRGRFGLLLRGAG